MTDMNDLRLMDTVKVIQEVKVRECLWNPRNVQYKIKMAKYKAWEAVAEAVLPTFTMCNKEEKSQIVRAVQSRWKTARDAYMKCRLTEKKKPTYKSKQHRYIYEKQLRFLEQIKDTDEGKAKDDDDTSNSFTSENTIQSTFRVSDDDTSETDDEDDDFDNIKVKTEEDETAIMVDNVKTIIDDKQQRFLHETGDEMDFDDIKVKTEEDETVIKVVNVKTIISDKQQRSLPGTSSQNNNQKVSETAVDKPNAPTKRLRNNQPRKIKSKMTEFETKLLNALRLKINSGPNSSALQADDQFFFNSLAPLISNFDVHQKLKFRSKILEAVMDVGNIGPANVKQETETYVYEEIDDDNS